MKKHNHFLKKLTAGLLGFVMTLGVGAAGYSTAAGETRGAEGDVVETFNSDDVVNNSGYNEYDSDYWLLSMGGNQLSAGWNKSNWKTVSAQGKTAGSFNKYLDGTQVTSSHYAWVAASVNKLSNVGKFDFTYNSSGSNQKCGNGKLYLTYSTNGTSYSLVPLKTGSTNSQGVQTTNNTKRTFIFDTIPSAYYAIIGDYGTGSHGSNDIFRFDNIVANFYEGATSGEVHVTSVELDKTTATISVDGTVTLNPTISPANASNQNVTWSSSNNNVATVADGVVTGVSAGTSTITVNTVDGNKTATCLVTVEGSAPAGNTFVFDACALNTEKEVTDAGATSKIRVTGNKNDGTNATAFNSGSSEWRMYPGSTVNGSDLVFTFTNITITGISIDFNNTVKMRYKIDSGDYVSVNSPSNPYAITNISATSSFTIQNANATTGQLKVSSVAFTYASAGPTELTDPNPQYDDDAQEIRWTNDTHADHYEIKFDNGSYTTTSNNPYVVSEMSKNVPHTVQVKAVGDGTNYSTKESSSLTFTITEFIPVVTSISLNYESLDRSKGDASVTLVATVKDQKGGTIAGESVTWSINDSSTNVVTVTSGGVVSFVGRGSKTIVATSTTKNSVTAECTVVVHEYYTVSFNGNGAKSGSMSQLTNQEILTSVPSCEFEAPDDKKFDHWAINGASGTTFEASTESPYNLSANITLYAVWVDKPLEIFFDFEDSGAHTTASQNVYDVNTREYSENNTSISCVQYSDSGKTTTLHGDYCLGGRIAANASTNPIIIIGPIDITNKDIKNIEFFYKLEASTMSMNASYSTDGINYTSLVFPDDKAPGTTEKSNSWNTYLSGKTSLYLKFDGTRASGTARTTFYVDDIKISYARPDDLLSFSISGAKNSFALGEKFNLGNSYTATATYSVSGVKHPTSGFSYQLKDKSGNLTTITNDYSPTLADNGKSIVVTYTDPDISSKTATADPYEISVDYAAATSITLTTSHGQTAQDPLVIPVNATSEKITAVVEPEGCVEEGILIDNEGITCVAVNKDDTLTGLSPTTEPVEITVYSADMEADTKLYVMVTALPVLEISDSSLEDYTGGNTEILVEPHNVPDGKTPTYGWSSSADSIASVTMNEEDNSIATISFLAKGEATITVVGMIDGVIFDTKTCEVTVNQSAITTFTVPNGLPNQTIYTGSHDNTVTFTPTFEKVGNVSDEIVWTVVKTSNTTPDDSVTLSKTTTHGTESVVATFNNSRTSEASSVRVCATPTADPSKAVYKTITINTEAIKTFTWNGASNISGFVGDTLSTNWTFDVEWQSGKTENPTLGTEDNNVHVYEVNDSSITTEPTSGQITTSRQLTTEDNGKYLVAFYKGVKCSTALSILVSSKLNNIMMDETIEVEHTATWTKTQSTAQTSGNQVDVDIDENIHMTGDKGSSSTMLRFWSDGIRVYAGNKITFTPKNGVTITSITFPSSGTCPSGVSYSNGVYTVTSGGSSAITITGLSAKTIGSDIVVTYTSSSSQRVNIANTNEIVQAAVIDFVNNNSSVTFDSWDTVEANYNAMINALADQTEKDLAANMFKYATASNETDSDCLQQFVYAYDNVANAYNLVGAQDNFLDRTLSATEYTYTVNANGGTPSGGSSTSNKYKYGATVTLPTSVTKDGYDFGGWYFDSAFTQPVSGTSFSMPASNVTVYAKWTPVNINVTFDANGGKFSGEATSKVVPETYNSTYVLPDANPSKTGYNFAGWWTQDIGGTEVKADSKFESTTAITLYAHWSPANVDVTFSANGGAWSDESTSKTVQQTYDSVYALPQTNPSREGFVFDGWYTEGGDKVTSSTTFSSATSITIYAHWSQLYNVSFTTGNVTATGNATFLAGSEYSATFEADPGYLLPSSITVTVNGQPFTDYTYNQAEGTFVVNSMPAGDMSISIEAHQGAYEIKYYDANGQRITDSRLPSEYSYGEGITLVDLSNKSGYRFAGWYDNPYYEGERITSISADATGNKTFYAKWVFNAQSELNDVTTSLGMSFTYKADEVPVDSNPAVIDNKANSKDASGPTYHYELVTSTNDLVAGNDYILVGVKNGAYYGIEAYASGNNCKASEIDTDSSGNLVYNTDIAEITLGGSTGNWTLYDGALYLYAAGGTGKNNYLKGSENANSTNAQWSISINSSNGAATIKTADSTVARHTIMFNTGSTLFSCYESGQSAVYLYKVVEDVSATLVSIEIEGNPTTTAYYVGDNYSVAGLSIKAHYSDESSETVSGTITVSPTTASLGHTSVTYSASYTEGEITKYADKVVAVTVTKRPVVYSGVDFRFNVKNSGLEAFASEYLIYGEDYGIVVSYETLVNGVEVARTRYFSFVADENGKYWVYEDGYDPVEYIPNADGSFTLKLGDVINNPDRASTVFTVCAYVNDGSEIYTSDYETAQSIKTWIKYYYDNPKYRTQKVIDLYNIFYGEDSEN